MSKQEDFHQPEKTLEKTREIDNEARISKKTEMKRKFNRKQKRIRHPAKLFNVLGCTNDPNAHIRTFCKHWSFI